ncbi:metal-dependent hydrolase family protein [Rubrimonas cliftonensis]|uniref:Imidazolonepropionase n=1 Tax=Rubrimonas cliftonensis TaxID=89524 RepID=A0A1H4F250_9RHOB|nr:amidohydrolase family protein [Rubrimonas cliftonensis]SEA90878.1 Imidazolonepropionase [Rubrimonas cliftonensis]
MFTSEPLTKRGFLAGAAGSVGALAVGGGAALLPARAQAQASTQTLITNVRVFDGKSDALIEATSVLIEGNRIKAIAPNLDAPADAVRIDGGGRVLMPGLTDMHTHLVWNVGPFELLGAHADYLGALTLLDAEATLMRGYTSIRDIGGGIQGVIQAIDEGRFPGPRIQSANAAITMTAGHGDFRNRNVPVRAFGGPTESELQRLGFVYHADGVPEMLSAARENMRQGANFLKIFVGGAVSGIYDPLDIAEYSPEEIAATAGEAERWNTYLAVHSYTDRSTRIALEQGAKSIEHGNLMSEATMELLVEKGAWLSTQTALFMSELPDGFSDAQKDRQKKAAEGLDNMMTLAKQYGAKIALSSDMVGSLETKAEQLKEFTWRTQWFSNLEILKQTTSQNAQLWAMSGPRNPYGDTPIGVIEPEAYADLLIMEGNPLEDTSVLTRPEANLNVIMKDGKIYKNTLE